MGAEFIANDRPIVASYKGEILLSDLRQLSGSRSLAASWPITDYRDSVIHFRRDRRPWLDALAADPLFLPVPSTPSIPALCSDKAVHGFMTQPGALFRQYALKTVDDAGCRSRQYGTGSAPTIRRAT